MTKTTNLQLNKPNADDFYSIDVQNENMDIIDTKVSEQEQQLDTAKGTIDNHIAGKNNPHGVTKAQVGLGNVNNTADSEKSVKYATSALQDANGNNIADTYTPISTVSEHTGNKNNPHNVTKSQVGLSNVPNVGTNDQTPTYTVAGSNTALVSGEKMNVAFGKIAKAVNSLISHLTDTVGHITSAERTAWNNKLNSTAKAVDSDKLDGLDSTAFVKASTITATGLTDSLLTNLAISDKFTLQNLCNNTMVTFFSNWTDNTNFPKNYGSGVMIPCLDARHRIIYYSGGANDTKSSYIGKALQTDGVWSVNWIESVSVEELSKYQLKSATNNVVISSTAPTDTTALWVS